MFLPSSMIPMKWSSTTPPRSLHLRNSSFLQKKCSCASMQRRTRSPISRSILSRVCSSACIHATSTRSIGSIWCTKTARIPIPTTRSGVRIRSSSGWAVCQGLRASATCAAPTKRAWVPICSCRRSAISISSRLQALRQRACSRHHAILSMQPTKTVVSSAA